MPTEALGSLSQGHAFEIVARGVDAQRWMARGDAYSAGLAYVKGLIDVQEGPIQGGDAACNRTMAEDGRETLFRLFERHLRVFPLGYVNGRALDQLLA